MESVFHAVLITLSVSTTHVEEVSRVQYETVEECERHKRQKEFTTFNYPGDESFPVFLCEWN